MDKLCPRCKQRLVTKRTTYCNPCSAEYQQELARGEHTRWRLCEKCGEHFSGKGGNALCSDCRLAYRERECSECHELFWYQGPHKVCVVCRRKKRRDYMREHARDHRVQRREKMFGLEPGEWQSRLDRQQNRCAICGTEFGINGMARDGATMDHDHSCCDWTPNGKPTCGKCNRDIICKGCNLMIGLAEDNPDRLRLAIAYFARWEVPAASGALADYTSDSPSCSPRRGQSDAADWPLWRVRRYQGVCSASPAAVRSVHELITVR